MRKNYNNILQMTYIPIPNSQI